VPYSDPVTRVAALLAAGAGTRFSGPTHKLQAFVQGRPVWEWALEHARGAGFDHLVVVTGAIDLPLPEDVIVRHNPDWAAGQATSLRVAVDTASELGGDAVTVGLADQPFVSTESWRAIGWAADSCRIAIATYDGVTGPHPVRLHRDVWPQLPASGDEGARSVLRLHPEWVCRIPCLGSVADIDTTEDLDRWKSC
jgi:CTP:molybdopterin cytidylyltransferase MocA